MRLLQILFFAGAFVLFSGFGSCTRSLDRACKEEIPNFRNAVALASSELASDRRLASSNGKSPEMVRWQDWSVVRLKEVQLYLDVVLDEPKLEKARRDLSSMATEPVAFYGFAHKGQLKNMTRSMGKIEKLSNSAMSAACKPAPAAGK